MPRTLRVSEFAGSKLGKSDHAIQHELNSLGDSDFIERSDAPIPAYLDFQPDRLIVPSDQSTLAYEPNSFADAILSTES